MALIADRMEAQRPQGQPGAQQHPGAQQQGQQPPADRQALPSEGEAQGGEEGGVTPEEQAAYDSAVNHAMTMMYDGQTAQQVLQVLQGGENLAEGVAQAAVMILSRVYDSSRQQGQPLSDDVLMAAGEEIVGLLFELAEAANIGTATDDDVFMATTRALQLWAEAHPDMLDQEGMQQSMQALPKDEMTAMLQQMGGE
jgi:hypothetical protein